MSILEEKLPVLIRETLQDHGTENCHNNSPDIIVRKTEFREDELADIFARTYDRDISVESDDSGKMYLYVRFKNISGKSLTGFYIHLYRNHLGSTTDAPPRIPRQSATTLIPGNALVYKENGA